MAKVKIQGNASGTGVLTVTAPNTSTDRTITLPDATGTLLNSDGSGASLTNLPNGSQLDYSGTKTIEAVSGGALVGGTAGAKNITVESTSGSGTISLIQLKNAGESFNLEVGRTAGAFTIRDNTNGERLKLDSTGAVTIPSQPAFQAKMTNKMNNIAVTTATTLQFDNERFDNNSDFNTSTYTFTAPVTGKYQFNMFYRLEDVDTAANYYHLYFYTSNSWYYDIISPKFTTDLAYMNQQLSVLADMDANDTAYVQLYVGGGHTSTDIAGGDDAHFSGYLVC